MEVYEVVVKAEVIHTFRVLADNQQEATERAGLMFANENLAKVLNFQFNIHNSQEPGARSQEPGARSQEPGANRIDPSLVMMAA